MSCLSFPWVPGSGRHPLTETRGESTCAFPADYILPSAGLKAQLRSIQLKGAVDSGIQPCAFSDFNEGKGVHWVASDLQERILPSVGTGRLHSRGWLRGSRGRQEWDANVGRRAWGHEGDQAEGQEPRLHGQGQTKDLSQRKSQRRRRQAEKGKAGEETWSFGPLLFCGLMLICCSFQDKDGLPLVDQSDQPLICLTEESGSFWGKYHLFQWLQFFLTQCAEDNQKIMRHEKMEKNVSLHQEEKFGDRSRGTHHSEVRVIEQRL